MINLKRQGLIQDFFITSPSLFDVPDEMAFDVVWLQRPTNSMLVDHLEKRIGSQYLVDLDDLLIGRPSYVNQRLFNRHVVLDAIRRCKILTVTSLRLAKLIEKHAGPHIMEKVMVCPNGFEFAPQIRQPSRPVAILISSSDTLALSTSKEAFVRAITKFSILHSLPVYYFGDPDTFSVDRFSGSLFFGKIGFWHYHALLASFPTMIGAAPLETFADEATLDFINGKSDIKMIDFGGFGHPSVYSNAPPYTDTDLKAGIIVENSEKAWLEGLAAVYNDAWQKLDHDQHNVIQKRNMNRLAAECWYEAILKARLPQAVKGSCLKFPGGTVSSLMNQARHILFSQDHFARRSLERRAPSVLKSIARKFLGES
ncbi:MAG: hypothetical protein HY912_08335 [Desulfomonile tiedjei]|uniref:Uncharacterized protein n=1 Tax=Desulfomonile tiedjei TaxID=2358 RepID=A0A9D6V5G4_9BACT|nr:hypothetical protein [Desulfomonile tiedjei]